MVNYIEVNEQFIADMEKYRQVDKSKGLLENCSSSVVLFAQHMLGVRLYAWQVYVLNSWQRKLKEQENRENVVMTSRQIGKSTMAAIFSLWATLFNKAPGTLSNHTVVGITSASDVQAKKLLYEIKKLINQGDRFMDETYKDKDGKPAFGLKFFSSLVDDNEPNNTTTISFKAHIPRIHGPFLLAGTKNGSVIKSYPPTSVVLGESFTIVVIDEAGKTDKISDEFFYDFIYPTGNKYNALRTYLSTPWTNSGFFYRLVNPDNTELNSPAEVFAFTVDAIKLEDPDYYASVMKTVEAMNQDGKTDEVQRAYYCRFVRGEANYFNPEKVHKVFRPELKEVDEYKKPCDMGIDFGGQVKSRTVITITEFTEDKKIRRLFRKYYQVGQDTHLLDDVYNLLKRFNVQRIIPDECPQGDYFIRLMKEKGLNVHPMNFRAEKVKKYGAFRASLNRGEIESFLDGDLKTEMLALEYEHGKQASVIHAAPGYNDDFIDSFVLSAYFFVQDDTGVKIYDYYAEDKK